MISSNPLRSEGQSRYGWVVVGVSATVNSLAWSVRSTFAAFYVALLGEFAWRRGEAALGYSLSWLLLLVFSPLAGWLYDRWGARLLVPAGGLLLGTALALTGRVTTLWQYYLAFGVLGGAGIACIQIPAAAILSRWFVRSRGAAMGVVSAGASASAIVFYPLNTYLIVVFGWRTALAMFGLLVAVVTIPLAAFLYRDPPEKVDGRREVTVDRPLGAPGDWTLGMALRSVPFWAVFAMWGFGVIGYQIVTTHQVAHAVDRGFSADPLVQDRVTEILLRVRSDGDSALRALARELDGVDLDELVAALESVLRARGMRYIMANIPRTALDQVRRVLPGLNGPTVIDVLNGGHLVAVHAVVRQDAIYRTIADLKTLGGEGILVTRIERLMP